MKHSDIFVSCLGFLLMYKLCERGESVFPLYLVDKDIPLKRLAVWNGIIRSLASVAGKLCCLERNNPVTRLCSR
jgi:hypothetical protein